MLTPDTEQPRSWARAALASIGAQSGMPLIVFVLPTLIALVRDIWLSNPIGDLDPWYYYGYFQNLADVVARAPEWGPPRYFGTRLSVILPGFLVHQVFAEPLARFVFHVVVVNGAIGLSFWFIARTHLPRATAIAVTIWLLSDIFYLRTIGWAYVDNGVLAFACIALALLTRGARSGPLAFAGVGACVVSMISAHLWGVFWLPVMGLYYLYVTHPLLRLSDLKLVLLRHALPLLMGAIGCFAIFGAINHLLLGGPFLYQGEQIAWALSFGPSVAMEGAWVTPLEWTLPHAYWLTTHFAVWIAALAVVIVRQGRLSLPTERFGRFWVFAAALVWIPFVAAKLARSLYFLDRDGMFVSYYFPLTYLAAAIIVFGDVRPDEERSDRRFAWKMWPVLLVFPVVACARLVMADGRGLSALVSIPMYALALAQAALLIILALARGTHAMKAILVVFAASFLLVPWRFQVDRSIVAAHEFIARHKPNASLPKIIWVNDDPNAPVFRSVAASFTDYGDGYSSNRFPEVGNVRPNDVLSVLATRPSAVRDVAEHLACSVTVEFLESREFEGSGQQVDTPIGRSIGTPFVVHVFRITSTQPERACP